MNLAPKPFIPWKNKNPMNTSPMVNQPGGIGGISNSTPWQTKNLGMPGMAGTGGPLLTPKSPQQLNQNPAQHQMFMHPYVKSMLAKRYGYAKRG